jgi:hypothetical protein
MVVCGQPKTTAEYIQATSRVGRDDRRPGLVLTLLQRAQARRPLALRALRDLHESFYRGGRGDQRDALLAAGDRPRPGRRGGCAGTPRFQANRSLRDVEGAADVFVVGLKEAGFVKEGA